MTYYVLYIINDLFSERNFESRSPPAEIGNRNSFQVSFEIFSSFQFGTPVKSLTKKKGFGTPKLNCYFCFQWELS